MQLQSVIRYLSAGILCVLLVACGGCQNKKEANSKSSKPHVALIMKSLANEFFKTMEEGAKTHQLAHPDQYQLTTNGIKDELDLARQVSLVEGMIADEVDIIVIAPADSKALVPVLKRAQKAGIIVVNIDNKLDDAVLKEAGVKIPFVGPDNRAGAKMVGDYLAKQLNKGDEVAILEGVTTSFNGQQRRLGFEEAMKAAGMKVVKSQSAKWEMELANKLTSAMLSEHPAIKALLCSNDSMAMGAMSAVKTAGLSGKVKIVGFDNISAIQQAIKQGDVTATADQHADQIAVFGIERALKMFAQQADDQDQQTDVDLVTKETLK